MEVQYALYFVTYKSPLLVCNFSPFQQPKLHGVLNFHLKFFNLILSFQFRDDLFLLVLLSSSIWSSTSIIDFDHRLRSSTSIIDFQDSKHVKLIAFLSLKLFASKFTTTSLQTAGYVLVIGKRVLVYILEQYSDIQALDNDINVHNLCAHLLLY